MGPRHCALANRLRQLQSTRVHRIFVYEARPPGDGLSRSLTTKRLAKGTKPIQGLLRWQTQVRLGPRERPRSTREQTPNPVVVAMARELRAFLWASAQDVPRTPATNDRWQLCPSAQKVCAVHRQRRRPGVVSPSTA